MTAHGGAGGSDDGAGGFVVEERPPTVVELKEIFEAIGWLGDLPDDATVELGLHNSLYAVCVSYRGRVVVCARVVGDGAVYFYLQDVAVKPQFQSRGVGTLLMRSVLGYVTRHAADRAFIGLMAAPDAAGFYQRFGFSERPAGQPGMYRVWNRANRIGA